MKIMKCNNCGKLLHITDKCYHCGSVSDFEEIKKPIIHENVEKEYACMQAYLIEKKYEDAISLSHKIIQWMPDFSGVFWMRVLAKNKCSTDSELIQKGFSFYDSADFYNAIKFGDEYEKRVYQDVKSEIEELKKEYLSRLLLNLNKEILGTNILRVNEKMSFEIEQYRNKLFDLWTELEKTEQKLYIIEMKSQLLVQEYKNTLETAHSSSVSIKNQTYQMQECTEDELYSYQVKIDGVLYQSEQAREAIENMKENHSLVTEFNKLVSERNQQIGQIENELSELRQYEQSVQSIISVVEQIESKYKVALEKLEKYDFCAARNILDQGTERVLVENDINIVGVNVG